MARYIDAELAIEKCNKLINNADSCPNPFVIEGVRVVRNVILTECETGVPTADVVPNSEVEKWFRECEELQGRMIELEREVARETIEFIEGKIKAMEDHTPTENLDRAIGLVNWILSGVIAELENKYTEVENGTQ